METIKVNMNPNPLDVQTIHASQNDGEARQWGFELHNNGDVIDASEISDQLVFKAYKGGTEQLLPENTSTPTTSPFKGDIKYPQGLLTDQEFTYRQSPTESDGLAKITDIKGNTIVWNQILQNGNFETITGWSQNDTANTLSVASNEITVTVGNPIYTTGFYGLLMHDRIANHKYLFVVSVYSPIATTFAFGNTNDSIRQNVSVGWNTLYAMVTNTVTVKSICCYLDCRNLSAGSTFKVKNYQAFDLTQMGLDITNPSDFTSLFPLSYYSYNQGSLLSFNGNGIKTVGKNQFKLNPSATSSNIINVIDEATGAVDVADTTAIRWSTPYIGYTDVVAGQTYTASLKGGVTLAYGRIGGSTTTGQPTSSNQPNTSIGGAITSLITNATPSRTFVANETQRIYWYYCTDSGNANHQEFTFYPQIEIGSTASDFEPYTSSALSLPISTYFPTGMKSAGTAYDELTPRKATTRIGAVDLGTLNWSYVSADRRFVAIISDAKSSSSLTVLENIVSAKYENATWENILTQAKDKIIALHYTSNNSYVAVIDSDYTDATTFKTAMSGIYLYYELATPTETSFTTASLVTENAEIPLSNEDGTLIGKCTEQLSENPGFFDAKIKLADADGECYSNKIQLHVERSPQ